MDGPVGPAGGTGRAARVGGSRVPAAGRSRPGQRPRSMAQQAAAERPVPMTRSPQVGAGAPGAHAVPVTLHPELTAGRRVGHPGDRGRQFAAGPEQAVVGAIPADGDAEDLDGVRVTAGHAFDRRPGRSRRPNASAAGPGRAPRMEPGTASGPGGLRRRSTAGRTGIGICRGRPGRPPGWLGVVRVGTGADGG